MEKPIYSFMSSGPFLGYKIFHRLAINLCEVQQLNKINPAFAGLAFRNEGLRFIQLLGNFNLRTPCIKPGLAANIFKFLVKLTSTDLGRRPQAGRIFHNASNAMLKLGKYDGLKLIGSGRFGDVYKAVDRSLDRTVAVKILKPEWAGDVLFIQQFRKEARCAAKVKHPNVVEVYEVAEQDGRWFIAMPFMSGGSLNDRLKARSGKGGMAVKAVLKIALEIAEGLAALHQQDLVHSDVKPSNILFDEQGHAQVSDLGLALSFNCSRGSLTVTAAGAYLPGQPAYMSPEQESGAPHLRPQADVYALGLILFEMLSGRSHKNLRPGTKLSEVRRDAPTWLDFLLEQMLAEEWKQRLFDGEKTAQAIRQGLETEAAAKRARQAAELRANLQAEKVEARRKLDAELRAKILAEEAARRKVEEKARRKAAEKAEQERKERAAAEARSTEMKLTLAPGVEMTFVRVPAGKFLMGAAERDKEAKPDERPQHTVHLDEYWIGKYPVTNAQFQAFLNATRYAYSKKLSLVKNDHPVVRVNWYDAVAFCDWATKVTGQPIHLPSEAQWEKASRGTDGQIYPWGNVMPDANIANFGHYKDTTPVKKYPQGASPYMAMDMAGNVKEWVSDWYDENYYKDSPASNPSGPSVGDRKVLRGGSWNDEKANLRGANRDWLTPGSCNSDSGFRCSC